MPYSSIPGVKSTYLDGAFKIPTNSTQDKILVVGAASSGRTNEVYTVTDVSVAETEFGAASEIMRSVHEAIAQGADNLLVIRSGGKEGNWLFADSASATLTITPEYRDDDILGRYKLVIENDGSANRYLVYDVTRESYVYDSSELLIEDTGLITVEDTGIDLFTLFDKTDLASASTLDSVVVGDFTVGGTATAASVVATEGTDGTSVSRVEKYASLDTTYHLLDYRDADLVIPTDVYIDDSNIADDTNHTYLGTGTTDGDMYGYFWKGLPAEDSAEDFLGYVWQYRYKGRLYTYFADVDDYFAGVAATADAATATVNTDLVLTASKVGKGGNAVTIEIDATLSAPAAATITETDFGFDIFVSDDGTGTTSDAATAIDAALALKTLRSGVLASTLMAASTGGATLLTTVAKTNLSGGTGGAVLTHNDLTDETIPSAVSTKFSGSSDATLREVNFAHQLASFCRVASTNWAQIIGAISFKAPTAGYSRVKIADWVGVSPTFTDDGTDLFVDAPSDNGSGILGHKLMAGFSKTSEGYRSDKVDSGDSTDGYAYGGIILTKGNSLPNGSDWPYGIKDSDELLDSGGKEVDIGKHIFVCYDYPILTSGYNGGTRGRSPIPAAFFGKIVTMPENEEPIGINGALLKINSPTRVHSTQINDLAKTRIIGIRRDTDGSNIITTAKTAAHPDSDYTRISTIRSINRLLTGIRSLARPYIGKEFSTVRLASLQTAIDGYLVSERAAGIHSGAKSRIEYNREDKIMGRLTIKLRAVPPFSIEAITVQTSLAADESEL